MGKSCHTLKRFCSLDTLLEAAAVRYARKGPRNKLRVVPITGADEYLVFVRYIEVGPDVKLVVVLVEVGTDCII
jgi:hypothetical protein